MLLTADRQAYTDRAVRCYLAQTHQDKFLFILDTGVEPYELPDESWGHKGIFRVRMDRKPTDTIGSLRNFAAEYMVRDCDAIAHWDSDDWSHELRLQQHASNFQYVHDEHAYDPAAVGYNNMVFNRGDEAWVFRSTDEDFIVGASLCFRSDAWRNSPFPNTSQGEDTAWLRWKRTYSSDHSCRFPVMICDIHAGNTSNAYRRELMESAEEWTRRPDLDEVVAKVAI